MKRIIVSSMVMLTVMTGMAGTPESALVVKQQDSDRSITGSRADEVIVKRVEKEEDVEKRNEAVRGLIQEQNTRGFFDSALGAALKTGYGTLATQKAVNLTSNLIDFTVNFITTAITNRNERFNNWYKTAKSYRQFSKVLSQQQTIGDFYGAPSLNGAFDPENIIFDGIGCSSYFSSNGRDGKTSRHDDYCYIFCKMRTDSIGMKSIVNHSKFLLEIDSIYFRPNLCDVPSNITRRVTRDADFFEKHTNLKVVLTAKVYSSWFNEAIMLQRDQLLGSFDIVMNIDKSDCTEENGEWVFRYSRAVDGDKYQPSSEMGEKRTHRSEISISGDSFIVPRSFSMDMNSSNSNPIWGTGEYRVDLTLSETCDLNPEYYYAEEYKPTNQKAIGNGRAVAFAALPGEKYFDKKIWQAEWVEMSKLKKAMPDGNDRTDTFWGGAWKTVVSTMKGSSWTTTFLSPLVTAVTTQEAKELNKLMGIKAATPGQGAGSGTGAPTGNPKGGEKPQTPPSK